MPYVGGSLVSLFDDGPQMATKVALRAMAERGGDQMVDHTIQNTPIDGGNLRTSWYQLPTKKTHYGGWEAYESGVASDVDYAPHVEYGTGLWGPRNAPYVIRPKNPGGVLRWVGPSGVVYAREVLHPGSPGQHMVAIAAEMTEHEADGWLFNGVLQDWKRAVEASAD